MRRPPRPRNAPLLSGALVWQIILVSGLFLAAVFGIYAYALDAGHPLGLAQTMAMNMLVVLEILYLFYSRNLHGPSLTWRAAKGTKIVWICVSSVIVAQIAVTYAPPLQGVFGTRAVPLFDGALILVIGVVFFALIETEKQMRLAFGDTAPHAPRDDAD